jgi:hypothetical protein
MGADAPRKPYLFAPINISQTSNNNPLATIARAAPTIHTSALQFTLDVAKESFWSWENDSLFSAAAILQVEDFSPRSSFR